MQFVLSSDRAVLWGDLIALCLASATCGARLSSPKSGDAFRPAERKRVSRDPRCAASHRSARLDSLPRGPRGGPDASGAPAAEAYSPVVKSALDAFVCDVLRAAGTERSYSAPFALREFDKSTAIVDGAPVRDYQPLQHAGKRIAAYSSRAATIAKYTLIAAIAGGVKAACGVTVAEDGLRAASLMLSAGTLELTEGRTAALTATVLPPASPRAASYGSAPTKRPPWWTAAW